MVVKLAEIAQYATEIECFASIELGLNSTDPCVYVQISLWPIPRLIGIFVRCPLFKDCLGGGQCN